MFERRSEKLLPLPRFFGRMVLSLSVALSVILLALAVGVVGYHTVAGLPWIDSILNASMILTGMGPVDAMKSDSAKLFASAYALFSGIVFISAVGLLLAPVFHRVLHRFHIDEDDENPQDKSGSP